TVTHARTVFSWEPTVRSIAFGVGKVFGPDVAGLEYQPLAEPVRHDRFETVVNSRPAVVARLDHGPVRERSLSGIVRRRLGVTLVQVGTGGQADRAHAGVGQAQACSVAEVSFNSETPLFSIRIMIVDLVGGPERGEAGRHRPA